MLDPAGGHAAQVAYIRGILPEILDYTAKRAGRRLKPPARIIVGSIREGDKCAVRGLAVSGARDIYIYVGASVSQTEINTALAHEVGHLIHSQAAGGIPASTTLAEGFASYTAGKYWPNWTPDGGFQPAVARYISQNRYIPLTTSPIPCDIRTRDTIYTERAAFVEWLMRTYGPEKFWRLSRIAAERGEDPPDNSTPYVTPPVLRENASYERAPWARVYGKDLAALEKQWVATFQSRQMFSLTG